MSADRAWEWHLAICEESLHHGECVVCGLDGDYDSDMYECPTCGVPVHEGACETSHHHDEHEDEEES